MSFYFFYFHHTDGKHPIISKVIMEREFLSFDQPQFIQCNIGSLFSF